MLYLYAQKYVEQGKEGKNFGKWIISDYEKEKGLKGELSRQRIVQEEGEKRGNKKEGEERRRTGEEREL
jgi:hypothetical protein